MEELEKRLDEHIERNAELEGEIEDLQNRLEEIGKLIREIDRIL